MIDLMKMFEGLEQPKSNEICQSYWIDPRIVSTIRVVKKSEEEWILDFGTSWPFTNYADAQTAADRLRKAWEENFEAMSMLPSALHGATVKASIREIIDEMKKW